MNRRFVRINLVDTVPLRGAELLIFRNRLLADIHLILARLADGRVFNYVGR